MLSENLHLLSACQFSGITLDSLHSNLAKVMFFPTYTCENQCRVAKQMSNQIYNFFSMMS